MKAWPWREWLGTAQALGWRPGEFWSATLTEFFACIEGFNLAHGGKRPISRERLADLKAQYGSPSGSIKRAEVQR